MNRRDFFNAAGCTIAGLITLRQLPVAAKQRSVLKEDLEFDEDRLIEIMSEMKPANPPRLFLWQGSDISDFSDPHPADYVLAMPDTITIIRQPKYRFLRFVCSDKEFQGRFYLDGFYGDLLYSINKDDILDLINFDWEKYEKRLANIESEKLFIQEITDAFGDALFERRNRGGFYG